MIKVNGVEIPSPTTFNPGIMDISKAERNALGDMVLDVIATKRKLELAWDVLSAEEVSTLFTLIKPSQFLVTYLDPETNTEQEKTFYKGDRNTGMALFKDGVATYKGTKVNFIEI